MRSSPARRPRPSLRRIAGISLSLTLIASGAALSEPPPGGAKAGGSGGVESFADPQDAAISGSQTGISMHEIGPPTEKPKPRPRLRPRPKPAAPKPASSPSTPASPAMALGGPSPPPAALPPFTDWRPLDAENTLIIETSKGRLVIALSPELAPKAVAQVKKLARRGVYDGLLFHRVIDGFVDQTGNPDNRDGGKSDEPNLPPEFTFRLGTDTPHVIVARPSGESEGFVGATPYVSVDEGRMATSPDHRVAAWGAFCQGVVGMGRDAAPNSANSELFLMRDPARRLDRDYTAIGRVISGQDVVKAVTIGEPPLHPDKMARVSVMADLPDNERPKVSLLNTQGVEFKMLVERQRLIKGADFSICDVEVPTRAE